jgi:hypothetical protein
MTGEHTQIKTEVSDCCGEKVKDMDTDLIEWHEDVVRLAKKKGQSWQVDDNPENPDYVDMFEKGFEPEEAFRNIERFWTTEK